MLLALLLIVLVKMLFLGPRGHILLPEFPRTKPIQPSSGITRTLVIASTTKDDTAWLSQIPATHNWSLAHYRVDAPLSPSLSVPSTAGNEAVVYLTYIVDHYDALPDVVLFHHAHLQGWHQTFTSLEEVSLLRAEHVLKAGYASTRCVNAMPSCENIVPLENGRPGLFVNFAGLDRETHLVTLLEAFLEPKKGETVPPKLAAPCCAQFAVSGERIRSRSKEWWVSLRNWLVETPLPSMTSGRLMEHLWHIWFGMPAVLSVLQPYSPWSVTAQGKMLTTCWVNRCPSFESCQCHVYGIGENCEPYLDEEENM